MVRHSYQTEVVKYQHVNYESLCFTYSIQYYQYCIYHYIHTTLYIYVYACLSYIFLTPIVSHSLSLPTFISLNIPRYITIVPVCLGWLHRGNERWTETMVGFIWFLKRVPGFKRISTSYIVYTLDRLYPLDCRLQTIYHILHTTHYILHIINNILQIIVYR